MCRCGGCRHSKASKTCDRAGSRGWGADKDRKRELGCLPIQLLKLCILFLFFWKTAKKDCDFKIATDIMIAMDVLVFYNGGCGRKYERSAWSKQIPRSDISENITWKQAKNQMKLWQFSCNLVIEPAPTPDMWSRKGVKILAVFRFKTYRRQRISILNCRSVHEYKFCRLDFDILSDRPAGFIVIQSVLTEIL